MSNIDVEPGWSAPEPPNTDIDVGFGVGVGAPSHSRIRPGQLSAAWQIMMAITWTAAFFSFSAVWKASVEIGIGTWWIGPRSAEQPLIVRILPFVLCVAVVLAAIYNVTRVALLGCIGAVLIAVLAFFDIKRSGGLAAIEFAIAGLVLISSLGAFAGTARQSPEHRPGDVIGR